MKTEIKALREFVAESSAPIPEWNLKAFRSEECLSYIAWNERTQEAIIIDPKDADLESYLEVTEKMRGYLWLGVIDTHTHADHISIAPVLAEKLSAPYIMLNGNSNTRVSLRIAKDAAIASRAGEVSFVKTPGHTQDSMTVIWGPFVFGGDTLLIGDTGRDDLPGGNPEEHYDSLQKLKLRLKPEMILFPGHDPKGIRASTWKKELQESVSLRQVREDFVRESRAFKAPAPKFLNESLRENLK